MYTYGYSGVNGAGAGEVSLYLGCVSGASYGLGPLICLRRDRARAIVVEGWTPIVTNGISQYWIQRFWRVVRC